MRNSSKSIFFRLSGTDQINKKELCKKNAPLQDSVRGYIRELSVVMLPAEILSAF